MHNNSKFGEYETSFHLLATQEIWMGLEFDIVKENEMKMLILQKWSYVHIETTPMDES